MATLDQTYTITLDTTEAQAKLEALNALADEALAKVEKCKELCGACTITLNAKDLQQAIRIQDYRSARTA